LRQSTLSNVQGLSRGRLSEDGLGGLRNHPQQNDPGKNETDPAVPSHGISPSGALQTCKEKQKLPFWLSGCREYTAVCSHPRGPNAGSLWAILWIGTCDNNPKFPGSEDPGYNSLLRVLRRSWLL
jgi:hypothetical protein